MPPPLSPIEKSLDKVIVWRISLAPSPQEAAEGAVVLSSVERQRADRLLTPVLRRRYTAAHVALRRILACELSRDPAGLEFDFSASGKPTLRDSGELRFNLSHSGDVALLAVSHRFEVGVDVEKMREVPDAATLSREYFHPLEQAHVNAAAVGEESRRFLSVWTRKEAYAKGLGLGLSYPTIHYAVPLEGAGTVRDEVAPVTGHEWWLTPLSLPEDCVGALACKCRAIDVEVRDYVWGAVGTL